MRTPTIAVLATAGVLAASAVALADPPEAPPPPAPTQRTVPERVVGAAQHGPRLTVELACQAGGSFEARGARPVSFACRSGRAAVRVPASVLKSAGRGRRAVAVRIRAGGRLTTATVGLDARMGRRGAPTAHAASGEVPTIGVMTHCYPRSVSAGGGGFQSVDINMSETFGRFSYYQTVYWQAYIYRSTTGTWASSTVDYYTIYTGGWSTGSGTTVYNPIGGYWYTIIGGTTSDPYRTALWNENGYWTAKYIPPRTYTKAAVHVWRPGGSPVMFYAYTNQTGYDPVWCYYA
jgi:hypothetical protein